MDPAEILEAFTQADIPAGGLSDEQLRRVAARIVELYPDRYPSEAEIGHLLTDEQSRPQREAEFARRAESYEKADRATTKHPTPHWRAVIDIETEMPGLQRGKARRIREELGISESVYLLNLHQIVRTAYAEAYAPEVCARVIADAAIRHRLRVGGNRDGAEVSA